MISCSYSVEIQQAIEQQISKGEYHSAIEVVKNKKSVYGEKNSVLYNLDLGLLYHYLGNTDSSNKYFFLAERQIEDLYTQSISQHALSIVLNDNVLPYEGEDFEKVLINIFLALNFVREDSIDEALVEIRKVDQKLREYTHLYEGKNKYQEDAFIRYIAGVLYESGGELNDAFISYKKSYEIYKSYFKEFGTPAPSFLLDDIVRTATLLGFNEEVNIYQNLGGVNNVKKSDGSILIIIYSGKGPVKTEVRRIVSIPDSSGIVHTFQVAVPKFVARHQYRRTYNVNVTSAIDTFSTTTQLSEDINSIAEKALNDRLTLLYLKSGGRALLKFLATEKIKKELTQKSSNETGNLLTSLAVDLFMGTTEQADTRSWHTLPAEIQIARIHLPPGKYNLMVEESDNGYCLSNQFINVKSGQTSFVIINDIR